MNPEQPQQMVQPQPTQSNSAIPPKNSRWPMIAIALSIVVGIVGFGAGYLVRDAVSQPVAKESTSQPTPSPSATPDLSMYRGGVNGVKLLEPVETAATQTLELIKLYHTQNGQYPDINSSTTMQQNWERYGYSGKLAGPSLKCPADNGYFSYTGYKNAKSGMVDEFELYYCNGLVKKTQADL